MTQRRHPTEAEIKAEILAIEAIAAARESAREATRTPELPFVRAARQVTDILATLRPVQPGDTK